MHEQIRDILPGEIVIIFTHNCKKKAIIGDLISRFILFYKQAEAIVVIGGIRDVSRLKRGVYLVQIDTGARSFTQKLIKD